MKRINRMRSTWKAALAELAARRGRVLGMGGEEKISRQHGRGKLTARERISQFFDRGSFFEVMPFIRHRCTDYEMDKKDIPSMDILTLLKVSRSVRTARCSPRAAEIRPLNSGMSLRGRNS